MKQPYFVSWSGGKDSCLALHRSYDLFSKPDFLLNMLTEDGQRSRSHGLRKDIIQAQADALGVPIIFQCASWQNYQEAFVTSLSMLKAQGIEMGVFGDIKIETNTDWCAHRKWADDVCQQAHMIAYEPLWDDSEEILIASLLSSGIKAVIIALDSRLLDKSYLGKELNEALLREFRMLKINPLGEKGEYHTLVIDSPLYNNPLVLTHGEELLRDDYWFLDVLL